MVPAATADVAVWCPASAIVIVVRARNDESLLDHIGFVGIAIRGVGVQVRRVQAGLIVRFDSLALFRRVCFGHLVIGTDALDVVHDLESLLA
jgi:hypothetical protein